MSYLIHPQPLYKHRCPECGLYFLAPQSHPFKQCPDCIEFTQTKKKGRTSRSGRPKKYKSKGERYRVYYAKHKEQILARKRDRAGLNPA
jgi:predicted  nucleic acid-binding Zn-ribbon protein